MEVYDNANNLAKAIKDSKEYTEYKELKDELFTNLSLKQQVEEFEKIRYEEQLLAMQGEKQSEEKMKKLQELYQILVQNPRVKEFFDKEVRFNVMIADINKIITEIEGLTLIEASELVKALEEKFGVSAAAPVAVAAAPVAGGAPAAAAEEKTEFNVVLKDAGAKKIDVIKVVRAFTGLGLVEAKQAVEKGGVLKENVAKEEADKIIADLKAAGATVVAE